MSGSALGQLRDGAWNLRTVLIGGLLLYYERVVFVPGLFVMGYLMRVLREAEEGPPPEFEDWFELAVLGVKAQLVWFLYLVAAPAVVVLLTVRDVIRQGEALQMMVGFLFEPYTYVLTVAEYITQFTGVGGGVSSTVLSFEPVLVFVLMLYLLPAALRALAEEGRLGAAFAPEEIRAAVTDRSYVYPCVQFVVRWLAGVVAISLPFYFGRDLSAFLVSILGVGFLENTLSELSVIVAVSLGFYLLTTAYRALGTARVPDFRALLAAWMPVARLRTLQRRLPSDRAVQVFLVGGLLLSTGLLLVAVPAMGYLVRVVGTRPEARERLPAFDCWWELWWDGVRVVILWIAYTVWPVVVLLAGQPVLMPGSVSLASLARANTVVGGLGVPVGPMAAYELDRVVRDVLYRLELVSGPTNNPYLVRDVATVSSDTWAAFFATLLVVLYLLPAAICRVATAEEGRRPLLAGLDPRSVLALAGRPRYARNWVKSVVVWSLGSGSVIAWYVWRRDRFYRRFPSDAPVTPVDLLNAVLPEWIAIEVPVPVPTVDGIVSATFLLVVSSFCFYCLVRGYMTVASGCELR